MLSHCFLVSECTSFKVGLREKNDIVDNKRRAIRKEQENLMIPDITLEWRSEKLSKPASTGSGTPDRIL
jgi:hypothetical protein